MEAVSYALLILLGAMLGAALSALRIVPRGRAWPRRADGPRTTPLPAWDPATAGESATETPLPQVADGKAGAPISTPGWSAARLRATLRGHLRGERVVIVSNRAPYEHHREEGTGEIRVVHPASGLVHRGRERPRPGAAGRGVVHAPARVARRRRGGRVLLRCVEQRALAALPRRTHTTRLPCPRMGPVPRGEPQVRRRGLPGGGRPRGGSSVSRTKRPRLCRSPRRETTSS